MKLCLIDNVTNEKYKIRRAWVKDGRFTNMVEIYVDPENEKGGYTSWRIKKVDLRTRIEEPNKSTWELRERYEIVMEVMELRD